MANPIFHSQYTAAQIEDLIENGAPIIQNGYWWRWDVATQQYVNTNITADSETAAQAAEAAQAAAEEAQGKAEDAQTAAETAQGLAEDARDAAAASAASIAASAAQIAANTARINYVALREEEDRQILFGSIVEAAEDSYPELRSAPIHNAITIGQSVYPRMDRTRMAIDAIKGRTVAFNQLVQHGNFDVANAWSVYNASNKSVSDGVISFDATADTVATLVRTEHFIVGHKVLVSVFVKASASNTVKTRYPEVGTEQSLSANTWYHYQDVVIVSSAYKDNVGIQFSGGTGVSYEVKEFNAFDITAQYNGAIDSYSVADAIAYVRQRMDLDYYASNAGELKAPVVSGVSVTGFNLWDEVWELGGYNQTTGAKDTNDDRIRNKNAIPVLPSTAYYFRKGGSGYAYAYYYDADMRFISYEGATNAVFTTPSNCRYLNFYCTSTYGTVYNNDICINISNPSRNGEYEPYQHTLLTIPSTRLDGVGTAQDYIEAVEDGENDYSLHLHKVMDEVDLGTLNWEYDSTYQFFYFLFYDRAGGTNFLCDKYVNIGVKSDQEMASVPTNTIASNSATGKFLLVKDIAYTDAVTFKAAMSGVMLAFEKTAPTETVIAEHLTLAQISAIAENGGIVSIVNENGHIVQPDMVCDVVVSRSAS